MSNYHVIYTLTHPPAVIMYTIHVFNIVWSVLTCILIYWRVEKSNEVLHPSQKIFTFIDEVNSWIVERSKVLWKKTTTFDMETDKITYNRICHEKDLNLKQ